MNDTFYVYIKEPTGATARIGQFDADSASSSVLIDHALKVVRGEYGDDGPDEGSLVLVVEDTRKGVPAIIWTFRYKMAVKPTPTLLGEFDF